MKGAGLMRAMGLAAGAAGILQAMFGQGAPRHRHDRFLLADLLMGGARGRGEPTRVLGQKQIRHAGAGRYVKGSKARPEWQPAEPITVRRVQIVDVSRYDGAAVRRLAKERGVGRPPKRGRTAA